MSDVADKLSYFQAITGIEDIDLCTEILSAHGWNLEQAISSITSTSNTDDNNPAATSSVSAIATVADSNLDTTDRFQHSGLVNTGGAGPPGLAWQIITLPISIISGSLGLVSSAIGLGLWVVGGVLSYSFRAIGLNNSARAGESPSAATSEAVRFVSMFEREYGDLHPNFVPDSFMDALQRSRREFKLMFVYLHSPDHPDTPFFCEQTLCSEVLSAFINENWDFGD